MLVSRNARSLWLLVSLSFVLRAAAWWWVAVHDVPPLYDEAGYLERAEGWRQILLAAAHLETPPAEALDRAYGGGHWPPLHAMLLGAVLAAGGGLGMARGFGVVIGTLSTWLVFRLGERLGGRKSGLVAAALHAVLPTFIAFSHYLWAETLAVALVLLSVLSALALAAALAEDRPWRSRAVLCGLWLGLAALTRVALAPWLVVVPAWFLLASHRKPGGEKGVGPGLRRRAFAAALCFAMALGVTSPWQMTLWLREGRSLPFSTLGGYNLALGNHPQVPEAYGSSWGHEVSKAWLHGELRRRGEQLEVPWTEAAGPLAWQEIRDRPGAALARIPTRLWMLWAPDVFPCRHLLAAVYPPLPPAVAGVAVMGVVGSHILLLLAAVTGLAVGRWRHRGLLLILLATAMVPPAATVALTRLHLPLEALLLPVAAAGLLALRRGSEGPAEARNLGRPALVLAGLIAMGSAAALPRVVDLYWTPSSYYAPAVGAWGRVLGASPIYTDRLRLTRGGILGELHVALVAPDPPAARLVAPGLALRSDAAEVRWPAGHRRLTLQVFGEGAPLELEIRRPSGEVLARWRPINAEGWRRPVSLAGDGAAMGESGLTGTWLGAGRSPR